MRCPFSLLTLLSLATLTFACGGDVLCNGDQSDYDAAYDACFDDGQADVCAGEDRGANYDKSPYDVCDDGLGDEGLWGCEDGYADGYDGGCLE